MHFAQTYINHLDSRYKPMDEFINEAVASSKGTWKVVQVATVAVSGHIAPQMQLTIIWDIPDDQLELKEIPDLKPV
jgi:hypothetical protein